MVLLDSRLQSPQLAVFVARCMNHADGRRRKIKTPTSRIPSLRLSEPQIALGKVVLGVAHTLASEFNDFLAHTIYLSSHDDVTIPDGMMVTINLGEASPNVAFFVALLATQDSACNWHHDPKLWGSKCSLCLGYHHRAYAECHPVPSGLSSTHPSRKAGWLP
ncbi:hypothetical protein BKA70DRAFT_1561512 [Coprinopsis sp. MPI-PUGE-AT-0042]|nr:hypothetical protein BKA70DRAFT_1561512 [Coprinopsis sp. MPI-PUGE-AT-0042]